jgi:hypothetical protein
LISGGFSTIAAVPGFRGSHDPQVADAPGEPAWFDQPP